MKNRILSLDAFFEANNLFLHIWKISYHRLFDWFVFLRGVFFHTKFSKRNSNRPQWKLKFWRRMLRGLFTQWSREAPCDSIPPLPGPRSAGARTAGGSRLWRIWGTGTRWVGAWASRWRSRSGPQGGACLVCILGRWFGGGNIIIIISIKIILW